MGKCVERNGIVYRLVSYDLVEVLDCAGERLGNIFINDGDWDLILGGGRSDCRRMGRWERKCS